MYCMGLFICLCLFVSCSKCGSKSGGGTAAGDAAAGDAAAMDIRKEPVKWKSESGMLLPSTEVPFGTAVPVKMKKVASGKRWCRYEGTWKMDEVLEFYKAFLKLPKGSAMEQKGRAFIFKEAHPVAPGNPGRLVEVRVVDEKDRGVTAVMIFDMSKTEKTPDWNSIPPYDPSEWKPSKPGEYPPEHLM